MNPKYPGIDYNSISPSNWNNDTSNMIQPEINISQQDNEQVRQAMNHQFAGETEHQTRQDMIWYQGASGKKTTWDTTPVNVFQNKEERIKPFFKSEMYERRYESKLLKNESDPSQFTFGTMNTQGAKQNAVLSQMEKEKINVSVFQEFGDFAGVNNDANARSNLEIGQVNTINVGRTKFKEHYYNETQDQHFTNDAEENRQLTTFTVKTKDGGKPFYGAQLDTGSKSLGILSDSPIQRVKIVPLTDKHDKIRPALVAESQGTEFAAVHMPSGAENFAKKLSFGLSNNDEMQNVFIGADNNIPLQNFGTQNRNDLMPKHTIFAPAKSTQQSGNTLDSLNIPRGMNTKGISKPSTFNVGTSDHKGVKLMMPRKNLSDFKKL